MEIEKQRGISVTSSVLQFEYGGCCVNLLDTPGHQDFSEDTYRTLMAADSAVMVIDASKGVEAQTRKLFQVVHAPDPDLYLHQQDRQDALVPDLLDDIEKISDRHLSDELADRPKAFRGVYERETGEVILYLIRRRGRRKVSRSASPCRMRTGS